MFIAGFEFMLRVVPLAYARDPTQAKLLAMTSELWRKLGDDEVKKATYRGG